MSKKFKKLCLQYSYLKMEEEETQNICASMDKDMQSHIEENYPDHYKTIYHFMPNGQPVVLISEEEPQENKEEANKNKDLKNLYREIAKKTHPDKKNSNSELFKESACAYADNDMGKMIQIATEANVNVSDDVSSETTDLLEENIATIHERIKSYKETASWAWHNTKNERDKEVIIINILHHLGAIL